MPEQEPRGPRRRRRAVGPAGAVPAGEKADEVSGQGVPGQGGPGQGVPGQGVPGQGVPRQGVPGQGVPGQGVPGREGQGAWLSTWDDPDPERPDRVAQDDERLRAERPPHHDQER